MSNSRRQTSATIGSSNSAMIETARENRHDVSEDGVEDPASAYSDPNQLMSEDNRAASISTDSAKSDIAKTSASDVIAVDSGVTGVNKEIIEAPTMASVGPTTSGPTSLREDVESQGSSAPSDSSDSKDVGRVKGVFLMLKTEIGLGVLSLPRVFADLGLVRGLIAVIGLRLVSLWSALMIGHLKSNNPQVTGIADAARLICGRYRCYGHWSMAIVFSLFWIFVIAAGELVASVMLNGMTDHGTSTAVFVFVASIVTAVVASFPKLDQIFFIAFGGIILILAALSSFTGIVANQGWEPDWVLVPKTAPYKAFSALSTIIFAQSGSAGFYTIMSEMQSKRKYFHSVYISQSSMAIIYTTIGTVLYCTIGSHLETPILASLDGLPKKIISGFALCAVIASTILLSHIAAKEIFRWIKNTSPRLCQEEKRLSAWWLGCTFGVNLIAYIIASTIGIFDSLVPLAGALFVPILVFFMPVGMWVHDNWSRRAWSFRWIVQAIFVGFVFLLACVLLIGCLWGSIVNLNHVLATGEKTMPWSSEDNSMPLETSGGL